MDQIHCSTVDPVARAHATSSFHPATDFFVNLTTRPQPMSMVWFVATSWIRDNQFWSDGVSQLLHSSGVFLIFHVPYLSRPMHSQDANQSWALDP